MKINGIKIIDFYQSIEKLKKTKRSGWLRSGVQSSESIMDHVGGVSVLGLLVADQLQLNREKVLVMCLLHDLCEAETGDLTPFDSMVGKAKQDAEYKAIQSILKPVDIDNQLLALWEEFEFETSAEGKLVKELDRLEMAFQAFYYEKNQQINMQEFFDFVSAKLNTNELIEIFNQLLLKRK